MQSGKQLTPPGNRMRWITCIILLAASCGDDRVTVGVILGGNESHSARLALRDALPTLGVQIDTVFSLASSTSAQPAIDAARRMTLNENLIAVVGHGNSAASIAASQLYNEKMVLQLSPHSTATAYSGAGPYSYRLVSPDSRQARFLAADLVKRAPAGRVALLYVNDDYGRGLRADLLAALPSGAVQMVLDAPHVELAGEAAAQRTVAAIVAARPDIILWLGRPAPLSEVLPSIRNNLGSVPVLGGDAIMAAKAVAPLLSWDNVSYVELVDVSADSTITAFSARYSAVYGHEPTGSEVLTYDATRLVLEAVRNGARSGREVRDYFDSLGRSRPAYRGVAGPIQFDSLGDVNRGYFLRDVAGKRAENKP